ncbi:MAG: hypothetical protein JO063_09735 [Pseudonocardiales bacterium]|nr:hypothetical protein [Pseudonocardiales bacterium]MBV9032223.1 hypothetical protein [Pseudonocardiales bacterium]MBW0010378.1 hypothetical protein [Pseudonocardiales bacterium]
MMSAGHDSDHRCAVGDLGGHHRGGTHDLSSNVFVTGADLIMLEPGTTVSHARDVTAAAPAPGRRET